MALKTFNIDEATYKEFSKHCKKKGISMSKKIDTFISEELAILKGEPTEVGKKSEGFENKLGEERAERERELMDDHPLSKYC